VLVKKSDFDQWAAQFRAVPNGQVDAMVNEAMRRL
jgi:hypothetical protein